MDFAKFKKNRNKIKESVNKLKDKKPSYIDSRIWKHTVDGQGNADVLMRFLPQKDVEAEPVVLKYSHGFETKLGSKKWFIEDCPKTIGNSCPLCEYIQPMWDSDKDEARRLNAKKNYYANVLIINDVAKPENNGRVAIYRFGVKVFNKIMDKLNPEEELIGKTPDPVFVHDLWEGANFKLKVRKEDGFVKYNKCAFEKDLSPVADTDEEIEAIYNQLHDLSGFCDGKKILPDVKLMAKFTKFMGIKKISKPIKDADLIPDDIFNTETKKVDEPMVEKKTDDLDDEKIWGDGGKKTEEKKVEPKVEKKTEEKKAEKKTDDVETDFDIDDIDFDSISFD